MLRWDVLFQQCCILIFVVVTVEACICVNWECIVWNDMRLLTIVCTHGDRYCTYNWLVCRSPCVSWL
jgi:hypothetical protein